MIILGIDPGIARCGYGVVASDSKKNLTCLTWGCLEPKGSTADRLCVLHSEFQKIISAYHPDTVSIESLFFGINAKTALSIGEARGVIILTATENHLPIFEYTPLQVKMSLTGYGRADKSQIQKVVKMILKLDKIPEPDDAADGLAIAITHLFNFKSQI